VRFKSGRYGGAFEQEDGMKRTVGMLVGLVVVAFAGVATADKVDDFKEASGRTGCLAIPYESERRDCESTQRKMKEEICKDFSCPKAEVEKNLKRLKEKRESLADAKSRNNESAVPDLEREIRRLEDELKSAKSDAEKRVRRCEDCASARQDVQKIFAKVRSMVKGESDEALKPFVDRLVSHYERGTDAHVQPIEDAKRAAENCKWVASISF
jgi:hypothetical protein